MLQRGTQIIYVPEHANGDIHHPDSEAGFVTTAREDTAFCRYWSKYVVAELRTKFFSELTPISALVIRDTVPQLRVKKELEKIFQD